MERSSTESPANPGAVTAPATNNRPPEKARKGGDSAGRLARIIRLIDALQSGTHLNSRELAERCGVSRRTVFRDIATLQQAGLCVTRDQAKVGYELSHHAAFALLEFSRDEALSLILLCQELGGTAGGIPFLEAAQSAALKVRRNLPPQIQAELDDALQHISISLPSLQLSADAKAVFELLWRAARLRRQVRVELARAAADQSAATILSPYQIVFRSDAWQVVGRSSLHAEVVSFRLGEIRAAEIQGETFEVPPHFSLERFFNSPG